MRPTRVLLAMALLAAPLSVAAPAAAAQGVGYVRLAHLSPDTPAVDVYLTSVGGKMQPKVFHAVGYGVVSDYMPLTEGAYSVAMRAENSAPSSPPVLSTQVSVKSGAAYTVAGVGRYADLGLRVINDDLSRPGGGQAKVRIVQASVRNPVLNVSVAGGQQIASDVAFATTTDYRQVKPGNWTCNLQPPDKQNTSVSVKLTSGGVYSMIVLDKPNGALNVELRADAQGGKVAPAGGMETGGGGTAPSGRPTAALVVLLLLASGGVALALRRWRRPAGHW
jgi:Domain of unknown function (DUF4397)